MIRIQRYILSEWLKVFFLSACLVMGLIVVQEVYSKLNGLLERGATAVEIISIFLLTIPLYLPSIIPMVLLLSVLFSISAMHRKNEIIAMRAAGVSLWRISFPLVLAAALCAGSILYLNSSFIPWSVQKEERLRETVFNRGLESNNEQTKGKDRLIRNLGSINYEENRIWLISAFYPFENKGESVTVYEYNSDGKEIYRISAARVDFNETDQNWVFFEGNELFYDGVTDVPYRNQTFEELVKTEYHDQPSIMVALRRKPQDLSLFELRKVIDYFEGYDNPEIVPYQVRFYRILTSPLSCFLVVGFGVPFAVSGVRTNPMIGISKAFGMFIAYFIISNLSTVMGDGGIISPLVSAVIPLACIGAIAVRVFVKAQ